MEGPLAMLRVKTRVQPQVTREMMTFLQSSQTTVRTKIRIDETGSVNVLSTVGANPMFASAVKAAVSQWKFNPTRDQNGLRCVETELPIVFSRQ